MSAGILQGQGPVLASLALCLPQCLLLFCPFFPPFIDLPLLRKLWGDAWPKGGLPPAGIWGKMKPGCTKPVPHLCFKPARGPSVPTPRSSSPLCHRSLGRTQAAAFCRDGLAQGPCQQSACFSSDSTGEGLAAACFNSPSPQRLSCPPSHRSQPVPALLLILASCLCLPPSSPLRFPAKLQRAGQQGRAVTRHSCWLL